MTKFTHIITVRLEGATQAFTTYGMTYDSLRPCRHDSLQNRTWTGSLPALAGGAAR